MNAIKCGNCGDTHESVAMVKDCYGIAGATPVKKVVQQSLPSMPKPKRTTTWRPGNEPMSDKQADFIRSLGEDRVVPAAGKTSDEAAIIARFEDVLGCVNFVSRGEASTVINWLKELPFKSTKVTGVALPDVPVGYYAVKSATGNNDLDFFAVDRPTEGRWAGRTFVKRVIGGHSDTPVRGSTAREALTSIVDAGVEESAKLYGMTIGRCYKCNKHLTDELSRSLGIGPKCRAG